jgi:NADPH:quinone reductase-like Zn-dependent oxidoreductase
MGTGGVSTFALQLAKLSGARVIATTSSDSKAERLTGLGADDVINYQSREDWDAAVLELTGKRGVDHVIEVGGSGTLNRSLNAVRHGGHVAMIGALTGPAEFNPVAVFMKSVRLKGIYVGSRQMFEDLNRAMEVGKVNPVIDRIFDFDEVKDALRYMESGSHFGKVVVRIQ